MKAISLFSGGLDSILATKLILKQGIEVKGVFFYTPFVQDKGVKKRAEELGIELKIVKLEEEYIELVKNPEHHYGTNMNPCIDCRALFVIKAKEYMEEIGAKFLFTGEVVGERPLTQNRPMLRHFEKRANLIGLILRPLSAKLLEPTIPEKENWVDREKLLDISGRGRKRQLALAQEWEIKDYPTPSGGCLLTDPTFSKRLQDSFEHNENTIRDMEFLKIGRHFRDKQGAKIIVSRNVYESKRIVQLAEKGDIPFKIEGIPSPVTIIRRGNLSADRQEEGIEEAKRLTLRYSLRNKGSKDNPQLSFFKEFK